MDALAWHEADESVIDYVGSDETGAVTSSRRTRRLLELDQHQRQSGRGFSDQLKPHERSLRTGLALGRFHRDGQSWVRRRKHPFCRRVD